MKNCDRCKAEFQKNVPTVEELATGKYELKIETKKKEIVMKAKAIVKAGGTGRLCPKCLKEVYMSLDK